MKRANTLIPRDFIALSEPTGSIFATTVIIAKRANKIARDLNQALVDKLADFVPTTDNLVEEVFENKEQIELSRSYEKKPNPIVTATEEFLAGEIMYRYPDLDS